LERRNFLELPFEKYEFRKVWDVYQVANFIRWKITGEFDWRLNFTHSGALSMAFYRNVRLLHFMNSISVSTTPWVSTYETLIPRYWRVDERHIELLAGKACKKLIAVSTCTQDLQVRMLRGRFPAFLDAIRPKLVVLQPSQRPLLTSVDERSYCQSGSLVLTLCGTEITRKGLVEVLDAVDEVRRRGAEVRLNLIGLVDAISYPYTITESDVRTLLARIAGADHVKHYPSIPNDQVLDIMSRTDLGLLPSYHDSHGYSVLEFQASGCPVVTSNIRALPEINTADTGWLIELPLDEQREVVMRTPAEEAEVRATLRRGLIEAIEAALNSPPVLRSKGEAALARIRRDHHPVEKAQFIESIYDSIVEG
jgi:glycosyltransferase involved in cell wall biosynthesis